MSSGQLGARLVWAVAVVVLLVAVLVIWSALNQPDQQPGGGDPCRQVRGDDGTWVVSDPQACRKQSQCVEETGFDRAWCRKYGDIYN